jgi:hypothetical protein
MINGETYKVPRIEANHYFGKLFIDRNTKKADDRFLGGMIYDGGMVCRG